MHRKHPWRRTAALLGAVAILAAACGSDDAAEPAAPAAPAPAPAEPAAERPIFDVGVTEAACENPAGGVSNAGNGCIYLGILSDLTEGPFAPLGVVIQVGQQDFWARVNDNGGIGGFDIDIDTYTRDTLYNPEAHSAAYRQIEPNILALAQSLGTPTTEAILSDMDADDVIAAPAGWWSGFNFAANSKGLILASGYSYCLESMIGLDWFAANGPRPIGKVAAVGYPGDFGGDVAAGAGLWAAANDVEFTGFIPTGPNALVGTQDAAVGAIIASGADIVVLGLGPAETAEIVGKVAASGAPLGSILFLGAGPTWNPALLGSPAAPALVGLYTNVSPWEDWTGTSAGHEAMRAAGAETKGINQGYAAGWTWQYPIKAALEAAAANGDLTRAGLRAVVDGVLVDYEGVLPTTRMGGDPNVNVTRTAVISAADPESPNGLRTLQAGASGPTADAFEYLAACSG
jgi:ABC-type branched-subunit amino acid transport system substrate-binding protein